MERLKGYCPMGCGQTLYVGDEGHVTCSWQRCPNPTAAGDILADNEIEHIVTITETNFTIQHPLRERLDGALHECRCHEDFAALSEAPAAPGRYRATRHEEVVREFGGGAPILSGWELERLDWGKRPDPPRTLRYAELADPEPDQ